MEIIEHGNPESLKRVKTFRCPACGCKFKADKTEYTTGNRYNETYYCCKCPECESYAYEHKEYTQRDQ